MQATVRCLSDNGRLLEIGKYDILKGTPLSMRPMLRNCAFEGIDLDRIVNDPYNITEVYALLKHMAGSVSSCWLGVAPTGLSRVGWGLNNETACRRHGRCTRCWLLESPAVRWSRCP